jgi:VWFA-related protein
MIRRLLALLAIAMVARTLTAVGQDTTFSVAAEEVRIDVLVTQNGKPTAGLTAADFEVFDNGILQEIQYATLQKQTPVSATLVFDMSRSVAGPLLEHLKEAAQAFLNDLKKEDQAALITFNNAVALGSSPTRDIARVRSALNLVQPFGNSSLIDGSYAGLVLAQLSPNPPLLIIFSDGRDTFSWLTGEAVLETAKRNGAVVYAVSTARLPEKAFLRDLSRLTGGSLFEVESIDDLGTVFLGILDEFRQRYLITYTPRGVPENSWHKLDVRVKNNSAKVSARPGYMRSPSDK